MLKRVITSLVYEICEFFAKRYLRKGIAMVKNRSLHLFAKRNEYNTCLFIFFNWYFFNEVHSTLQKPVNVGLKVQLLIKLV